MRSLPNDLNVPGLPASVVKPKGLRLALDLDHVGVWIPLDEGGCLLTGRRVSDGGERRWKSNIPVDENSGTGTPDDAVEMKLVAVEGRTREQGRAQRLKRDETVGPSSDPRSAGVDIGRRTDERVVEVEGLLWYRQTVNEQKCAIERDTHH